MSLHTTGPRERILLVGGWGAGKSTAAVNISEWVRKTESPARMFVVDTTYEAERNFLGSVDSCPVVIRTVEAWPQYMEAIKWIRQEAGRDDWLVVDRVDVVWDMAQAGFSEAAFGKEIDEWFVEYKRDRGTGHPFSGEYGTNWGTIKRMYGAFMTEVMRFPGHVLVCAKGEMVQQPNREGKGGDSVEVRAEYTKFGVKPAGEKNLGFLFHTVLLLAEVKQGSWVFTTIRDRGREQVSAKEMKGFVPSYLIGVAGWKP